MEHNRKDREQLLLDFHLDQLDEEEHSWIEAELLRDAELRAKSDRLGEILRPLDHWTAGSAPTHLADKILRAVRDATTDQPTGAAPLEVGEAYRPRPFLNVRELVAVAASIAVLFTVLGPGLSSVRSRSQRATCASNLASVFRGVKLYQQAFDGSLPFAGSNPAAAWLPAARQHPFESNSRHPYLIARLSFARPEDFVCPACKMGTPMRADELAEYGDFLRACNMSYASLNLAGANPNLRPPSPIPYMSDSNPLFINARFDPRVDPTKANSPMHGRGAGQNVLNLDGTVTWMTTPIYGVSRDNLWLAGEIRSYVGIETPTRKDDAFLIPGYPATDAGHSTRPIQ